MDNSSSRNIPAVVAVAPTCKYRKGAILETLPVWKLIPLFRLDLDEDEEDRNVVSAIRELSLLANANVANHQQNQHLEIKELDHFQRLGCEYDHLHSSLSRIPLLARLFKRLLFTKDDYLENVVATCLLLVIRGESNVVLETYERESCHNHKVTTEIDRHSYYHVAQYPVIRTLWIALQEYDRAIIDWKTWMRLIHVVNGKLLLVESPHPMHTFATQQLPRLSSLFRSEGAMQETLRGIHECLTRKKKKKNNEYTVDAIASASSTRRRRLDAAVADADAVASSSPLSSSPSPKHRLSLLSIIQQVQDRFSEPIRWGALVVAHAYDDDHADHHQDQGIEMRYPQSCIPTACLELHLNDADPGSGPVLHITALFDIHQLPHHPSSSSSSSSSSLSSNHKSDGINDMNQYTHDPLTLCYVSDHECVEHRERQVHMRSGGMRSCGCMRCRYEIAAAAENSLWMPPQPRDRIHLARYYMSQSQWEQAESLYQSVVTRVDDSSAAAAAADDDDDDCHDEYLHHNYYQLEAWHALGAIQLAAGHFLAAQRIWKNAIDRFPEALSCRSHPGLSLQMDKLRCYQYLEPLLCEAPPSLLPQSTTTDPTASPPSCSSSSVFPDIYVHSLLSPVMCQEIIAWAEADANANRWTSQRHYAVPTVDVPVHVLPKLLDWFNAWFVETLHPILVAQFGCRSSSGGCDRFFVHDAFVVRYTAGHGHDHERNHNHLPIHTDESTHSFVIALNDCLEYGHGGTYFSSFDTTFRLQCGHVLTFPGRVYPHGGEAVSHGTRYILVAFLYQERLTLLDGRGRRRMVKANDDVNDDKHQSQSEPPTLLPLRKRSRRVLDSSKAFASTLQSSDRKGPSNGFSFQFDL